MKIPVVQNATSRKVRIRIQDSTSTTGAGLTGLVYNSPGLTAYYYREGDASSTSITLGSATLGTWTSGGFVVVDGTNMKGVYELGVPNAAFNNLGTVQVVLSGATNMVDRPMEFDVTAVNDQVATFGLVLAKTTNITGFNDIAPTAVVSGGAINTSGGAVSNVTNTGTVTNLTNAPTNGDFTATMKTSLNAATPNLGTNAPANWINAGAIDASALNGKGDWATLAQIEAAPLALAPTQSFDNTGQLTPLPTQFIINVPPITLTGITTPATAATDYMPYVANGAVNYYSPTTGLYVLYDASHTLWDITASSTLAGIGSDYFELDTTSPIGTFTAHGAYSGSPVSTYGTNQVTLAPVQSFNNSGQVEPLPAVSVPQIDMDGTCSPDITGAFVAYDVLNLQAVYRQDHGDSATYWIFWDGDAQWGVYTLPPPASMSNQPIFTRTDPSVYGDYVAVSPSTGTPTAEVGTPAMPGDQMDLIDDPNANARGQIWTTNSSSDMTQAFFLNYMRTADGSGATQSLADMAYNVASTTDLITAMATTVAADYPLDPGTWNAYWTNAGTLTIGGSITVGQAGISTQPATTTPAPISGTWGTSPTG